MTHLLDVSCAPAREGVKLDSALFEALESGRSGEAMWFWESLETAVVLGHSGIAEKEVHLAECRAAGVPVLRRISGGGAVVAGPGCLIYSFVLSLEARPELHDVALSYELILGRVAGALGLRRRGLSDLALGDRKISGNSQRRGRRALLHHGTILYNFDIECIERFLKEPARQPSYRSARRHSDFVANLSMPVERITERIVETASGFAATRR